MERAPVNAAVLVLNQNYEPLNICNARRAFVLVDRGKAEVLELSRNGFRTPSAVLPRPSVIKLAYMVKRPRPQVRLSRREIFMRDDYTCQYCGCKSDLTIDHVFPRHRGGETTWENLVCCCLRCNNKKVPHSPQEGGMRLPHPPRKPRYVPYISFPRFVSAIRRPEWREYLEGYGKGLEF